MRARPTKTALWDIVVEKFVQPLLFSVHQWSLRVFVPDMGRVSIGIPQEGLWIEFVQFTIPIVLDSVLAMKVMVGLAAP